MIRSKFIHVCCAGIGLLSAYPGALLADIIQDSLCVGVDCTTGEAFGFDTLRLKENNLRIHFDDTSASASFPSTDWRIEVNDTSNGGANRFSIEDATAGRTPFTILGGASDDSLFVDSAGEVGLGTNSPAVELHIVDGDSPSIRLQQDGSSGFTPQIWDVVGNETNFFVRDVTHGSNLPFRILPGAADNAMVLSADGDILVGTANAGADKASLYIKRSGTTAPNIILDSAGSGVKWEMKANATTGRLTFKDLNGTTTPFKFAPDAAENLFRVGILASDTVDINGDLVVTGNCSEVDGACADYVFADDYELRSLDELALFIKENQHLPNVPSAAEMEKNGVSMAHITGRLLEKIEELTLYTLQQEEKIAGLSSQLETVAEQSAENLSASE